MSKKSAADSTRKSLLDVYIIPTLRTVFNQLRESVKMLGFGKKKDKSSKSSEHEELKQSEGIGESAGTNQEVAAPAKKGFWSRFKKSKPGREETDTADIVEETNQDKPTASDDAIPPQSSLMGDAISESEKEASPQTAVEAAALGGTVEQKPEIPKAAESQPKKAGLFGKLKLGLSKTRHQLTEGVASTFLGQKKIDEALFEEIEAQLLSADIGLETTEKIIQSLTQKASRKQLKSSDQLLDVMKEVLTDMLSASQAPLMIEPSQQPYVILIVGMNGAGKTTTIGKLAKQLQQEGKSVMLAAGDTFRAAAVEQLSAWGERNQVNVISQPQGSDSASVIFDAMASAKAKQSDVLIADTAGRLHTQGNLMEELKKIKRVMQKSDGAAPHEIMLVLDASVGQNALIQAREFHKAIGITGIVLTKLDGTAKGGVIFAIANEFDLPIRFIGVGEQLEDLRPFNAEEFAAALFDL